MGNTFDGVIREVPYIGLDRFNIPCSVFLLTHCHTDHLGGLTNKSFSGLVYCSTETKALLETQPEFRSVVNLVYTPAYNTRTRVELPPDYANRVYITLVKANHCTGACMFLVEEVEGPETELEQDFDMERVRIAVLCTGDVRAERWWCDGLANVPQLFPYVCGLRQLDNIYFDSSFAYRGEPYIEIPPNNLGIYLAICLLKKYPETVRVQFPETTLGFDHAWAFVASYFGAGIVVQDAKLRRKLAVVAKLDEMNGKLLQRALRARNWKRRFSVGRYPDLIDFTVSVRQCVDFNVMDWAGACLPILLSTIPKDEQMELLYSTPEGHRVYKLRDRIWLLPLGGDELLPQDVKLIFARHSSFTETLHLLAKFAPKQVFPCSYTPKLWANGFVMSRLFGKICTGSTFCFDDMMYAQYGLPVKAIMDRPTTTIDRWSVEECQEEQKFVEGVLQAKSENAGLALINIRKVVKTRAFSKQRTPADDDFIIRRNTDLSLQKLVEGRKEVGYQKFIETQQMLYYKKHNLPPYERDYEDPKYRTRFTSTLGGSSGHATDSCDSSLDLNTMCSRSRTQEAVEQVLQRMVSVSQPWHFPASFLEVTLMQKSFVESSFASFEESMRPTRSDSNDVYYRPEARINQQNVQVLSQQLACSPLAWKRLGLQCTK